MSCPSEEVLVDFAAERMESTMRLFVQNHLSSCNHCSELVDGLVRTDRRTVSRPGSSGGDAFGRHLTRGTAVGRYVILKEIGFGGMGVVFAAYDPDLDRRIALKLLGQADGEAGERHRARLLREGQALGRLSHPNVTQVYDVGMHEGSLFVTTELVRGSNLRGWLSETPRSLRDIMRVFKDAGEGLAAAHRANLIHRDFKPENLLVGRDGGVRVIDFGLARSSLDGPGLTASEDPSLPLPIPSTPSESPNALTQAGDVVGTPGYMSPEQRMGLGADEKSDQFSYCLTFYEALYGTRPFGPGVVNESAVAAPEQTAASLGRPQVPPWLQAILRRGLRVNPNERFESMNELLAALAEGENRHLVSGLAVARLFGTGAWFILEGFTVGRFNHEAWVELPPLFAYFWVALAILIMQRRSRLFRRYSHFAVAALDVPMASWIMIRMIRVQIEHGNVDGAWATAAMTVAVQVALVALTVTLLDPRAVAATTATATVALAIVSMTAQTHAALFVAHLMPALIVGVVGTLATRRLRSFLPEGARLDPTYDRLDHRFISGRRRSG